MKKLLRFILAMTIVAGAMSMPIKVVYAREIDNEKLIKKAERGDREMQYQLALRYQDGYKDIKQDFQQALHWFQQAGNQDHPNAQGMLGLYYKKGIGTEKDIAKAKDWYTKAEANGHLMSYLNHGMLLLQEKDYKTGDSLFQKVIDADTDDSLKYKPSAFYGRAESLYETGNLQDAYSWYVLAQIASAVRHNNPEDKLYMEKFRKYRNTLTPEQYKTALIKAMEYHYRYFVQHMSYFKKDRGSDLYQNTVIFKEQKNTIHFVGYHASKYQKINGAVNYLKDKKDRTSQINYAIWLLNQADSYLAYGSLWPNYNLAKGSLEEADKVFSDHYDEKAFVFLNDIVKERALLVKDLADLQLQIVKEYREKNNKT